MLMHSGSESNACSPRLCSFKRPTSYRLGAERRTFWYRKYTGVGAGDSEDGQQRCFAELSQHRHSADTIPLETDILFTDHLTLMCWSPRQSSSPSRSYVNTNILRHVWLETRPLRATETEFRLAQLRIQGKNEGSTEMGEREGNGVGWRKSGWRILKVTANDAGN